VDYHGGLADVRAKVLRMIGDPETRYREDPVRIVRAVRFAAKLGFSLERQTHAPVKAMSKLLANVPASRLFDEMIKLLQTGHALASLDELKRQGLGTGLFPILDAALADVVPGSPREAFVRLALQNTDERVADGRPVAPSFMLACLLWHEVQVRWQANKAAGESTFPALQQAIDSVFDARVGDISGRGKLAADMREIWQMQPRLERRSASSALGLVEQPRFRAGYDFLRLRADVGEQPVELADWWEDFSLGSDEEREALLDELRGSQTRRVPASKGGRSGSDGAAGGPSAEAGRQSPARAPVAGAAQHPDAARPVDAAGSAPQADAPRKRRRRRRPNRAGAGGEQQSLDLSLPGPADHDAAAGPTAAPARRARPKVQDE
jgi:poly(A) polymerase